ncbi:TetR family transcriptional regulator [Metabacillus sp. cB07]|uniref:TetR/AcrR family transcriptional regulator n=1 Tax=Metabacillus sp. cB07 TaxID=2806989 RepID=UPI00193A1B5D|nr:TetR family transcriptional regulator [Metabacillus sp. cB07]
MEQKKYLIADARKEQIMKAAIAVLAEIGYKSTSLSVIADKAEVSTGLISYHFSGKADLMNNTLLYLIEQQRDYIMEKVNKETTYTDKLIAFVQASVEYQDINRNMNTTALLEIVFNERTEDNVPYYKAEVSKEDELNVCLKEILLNGQQAKEFGEFDHAVVITIIRGGLAGTMSVPASDPDRNEYSDKLVKSFLKMVL